MLINVAISESPECFLGFLLLALNHKPSRAFGKEDDHDALDCGSDEEDSERDLVRSLAHDGMCSEVNTCSSDGSNRQHDLIESKNNTTKMSRSCFMYIELREGEEPSHRNT